MKGGAYVKDLRQRVVECRWKTGLSRGRQSNVALFGNRGTTEVGRLGDGDGTEIEGGRSDFEADR